jgi:hypothetical protein
MSGLVLGRPRTRFFEPAVPTEDRVRAHDARDVPEATPTERLSLHSQAAPLVVSEPEPAATALRAQDAVLLEQVVDDRLLLAVDRAREQKQEEGERGRQRGHGSQLPQQAPTLQAWPGTGIVTPSPGGRLVPGRRAPPATVATSAEFSHRTGRWPFTRRSETAST